MDAEHQDYESLRRDLEMARACIVQMEATHREQVRQAVRQSEQRYRSLFDHNPAGVAAIDRQGRFTSANPAAERICGYSRQELLSMRLVDLCAPEYREAAWQGHRNALEGHVEPGEMVLLHKDGRRVDVRVITVPIVEYDRITGVYVIAEDITPRKRAKEALQASQQKFEAAFQANPASIVLSEVSDGRMIEVNGGFERIFGHSRQEAVGRTPSELGTYADPACRQEMLRRLERDGRVRDFELPIRTKAGQVRIGRMAVERVVIGGQPYLVTTTEDITEQRQAEQALSHSHRQLQDVIDGAPIYVIIKGLDGQFITVNRRVEEELGLSREQLQGKTDRDVFPAELAKAYRRHDAQALAAGHPVQVEEAAILPDGQEQVCLASKFALVDPSGQPYAICVMSMDITERKRIERQLETLNETLEQRVAERTALAEERAAQLRMLATQLTQAEQQERRRIAHILHEHFQQLLVAVKHRLGRVRSHVRDAALQGDLQESEAILGEAIRESRSLTVELCPPVLYDMGLAAALQWLGRWMWDHHGLTVAVQADPQANPSAEEIGVLLFEAVRELLLNVVKHANILQAAVQMRSEAGQTCIVVADEGSGFDPAGQGHGKSFGLFGIQHRLGLLGGTFQVQSRPGRGTRVTLVSPQRVQAGEPPL